MQPLIVAMLLSQPALPEPHIRHVRVKSVLEAKATSVVLNLLSTSPAIEVPHLVGNMVRFDAEKYHPRAADLKRFLTAWEEFKYDPAFNVLRIVNGKVVVSTLHDPALIEAHATEAPVVDFPYFLMRAMSTIKDQGGNATIFGGLYYELSGHPATEAELVKSLGIDPGDDLLEYFDKLPSQLRAATLKSGVTGKRRRFDMLATAARFHGWLIVTRDVADGEQDGKSDPISSLARLRVVASETIYSRSNGMPGFFLSDGNGKRQDVAPHNVVVSDMVLDRNGNRNPHSTRLQFCIACHWAGDARGLLPLKNDVLTMKRRGIKIADPLIDRLYRGDPDTPGEELHLLMARAREDLVLTMVKCLEIGDSPGWPVEGEKLDLTQSVRLAGEYMTKRVSDYNYQPIGAREALTELGFEKVPKEAVAAVEMFNKEIDIDAINGEPLDLALLRKGFEIDRFHWSLIQAEVFQRMRR